MRAYRCAAVVIALASATALAQGKACSPADSKAAEQALDRVVNWDLLHKAWKDYNHCESGAAKDAFTEAFLRLAVQWKDVEQFAARYQAEPQYKAFIQRHIASPAAKDDAESLFSRAKSDCPPRLEAFCAEIAEAAKAAQGK